MKNARADHVVLNFKGSIFVIGGYTENSEGQLQTLNSAEMYSIEKDTWTEIAPI